MAAGVRRCWGSVVCEEILGVSDYSFLPPPFPSTSTRWPNRQLTFSPLPLSRPQHILAPTLPLHFHWPLPRPRRAHPRSLPQRPSNPLRQTRHLFFRFRSDSHRWGSGRWCSLEQIRRTSVLSYPGGGNYARGYGAGDLAGRFWWG